MAGDRAVDKLFLPQPHARLWPALAGEANRGGGVESLGVVETTTVAATVRAADAAAKSARVRVTEMQLARGIGGKAFFTVTGAAGRGRGGGRGGGRRADAALVHTTEIIPAPQSTSSPNCAERIYVLYRRFGRTDIDMSVFSCGGMRAQQTWTRSVRVGAASQANVDAVVARALAVGINHFETARGYGTSEAQFGKALARHPRSAFVLQTKLRPNAEPARVRAQLEESFALLGVDTIDLLSFHGLNTPNCVELTLRPGGCWEIGGKVPPRGRIRHIGFSTHAPARLMLDTIRSDRFDYVNLHAYYLFQDNLPAVAAARERDTGVFIISPTDKGGRLTRRRTSCAR